MSDAPKPLALVLRSVLLGACVGAVLAGAYAAVAPLIFDALLAFTNGADARAARPAHRRRGVRRLLRAIWLRGWHALLFRDAYPQMCADF